MATYIPEGENLSAYRRLACDTRVTGAVPRDPKGGVTVALQDAGGSITHLPVFYMAVTAGGKRSRAVAPRHFAIARRGFVSSGVRLAARIAAHDDPQEAMAMLNITRAFTAATHDGAWVLQTMRVQHGVEASSAAVATTLVNYGRCHLREFQSGNAGVASNTTAPSRLHSFRRL